MAKGWSGSPAHSMKHGSGPSSGHTGKRVTAGNPGGFAKRVRPELAAGKSGGGGSSKYSRGSDDR